MRDGLADEGVGVRHSDDMLAPAPELRWLYDPEVLPGITSSQLPSKVAMAVRG